MIPVPGRAMGTPYGARGPYWSCSRDSSGNGIHTGADFPAPVGTTVVAARPGHAFYCDHGSSFGYHQLEVRAGDGTRDFYAHMSARTVSDGQAVEAGDHIGLVGAEGNVTGPHLHFERNATESGPWSCGVVRDPAPSLGHQPDDAPVTTYQPPVDPPEEETVSSTKVSRRVGWGTNDYEDATPIVPSSYSLVEPNLRTSTSASYRHWQWTAPSNGSVRVDAMLSMPGPRSYGHGEVSLRVFHLDNSGGAVDEFLHLDGGGSTIQLSYRGVVESGAHGSLLVEAGRTYYFQLIPVTYDFYSTWGVSLRMSSFRAAEPTWYQPADRTITTYCPDGGYQNDTPLNPWDVSPVPNYFKRQYPDDSGSYGPVTVPIGERQPGSTDSFHPPIEAMGFGGSFGWSHSFQGIEFAPGELPFNLSVTVAWQHALCETSAPGRFTGWYASVDFDGTHQGMPSDPPYRDAYWGGEASSGVKNLQAWNETDFPPIGWGFDSTSTESDMMSRFISLSAERMFVSPSVGYTHDELVAAAGADPARVVGIVWENPLAEILEVAVIPDWSGGTYGLGSGQGPPNDSVDTCPIQWWVGPSRFDPDEDVYNYGDDPPPPTHGWGPIWGLHYDLLTTPVRSYYRLNWVGGGNHATQSLGGNNYGPLCYIRETGMELLGSFVAGSSNVWTVPEHIWRAAVEVEVQMKEGEANIDGQTRYGLTFFANSAEQTTAWPIGAGLSYPGNGLGSGGGTRTKGLPNTLIVWPKITYRPPRYQVCLAPPLEIPELTISGGPVTTRQHFEPVPPA